MATKRIAIGKRPRLSAASGRRIREWSTSRTSVTTVMATVARHGSRSPRTSISRRSASLAG